MKLKIEKEVLNDAVTDARVLWLSAFFSIELLIFKYTTK